MPQETSIYIAGFAAIISTISLLWNIFNAIISKLANMKVDFTIVQQMIADPKNGLGNPIPYFSILITNIGANKRFIKNPVFYFDKYKKGITGKEKRFQVIDVIKTTQYPIELEVGKEFNYTVNIANFLENFKGQLSTKEKIRIEVTDTHGKTYRSKKMKLSIIEEAINVANSFQ
jgi:hypothetical protein